MSEVRAARSPRTMLLLLVSAAILTLCMGLRQGLGLFLKPVTVDLGISASAFSFALAAQSMVWGASQPFVGMLADRWGTRPVVIATALVYAAGFVAMAMAGGAVALDIGGGLLAGIGIAGTGFGVLMGVVARAVPPERQSQAVGTVAALGSLGTFFLPPVGQFLIDGFGWRAALAAYAAIAASMALLALAIGRPQLSAKVVVTAEDKQTLGEVLRVAARHPGYVAMTAAFFACGFQLVFITTHLPSFLAFCGLPPSVSASALALIGLCNTVGTYAVGLLGARYSQKRLLATIYMLRTLSIGVYLALPISAGSTLVFAAAMGLLWLGVAPLVSGLIGRMFGLKHFSTLYGIVFFSHQLGSFCGAMLGGVVFDLTGSYGAAWVALIAIGVLAASLQWPMDDRPPAEAPPGDSDRGLSGPFERTLAAGYRLERRIPRKGACHAARCAAPPADLCRAPRYAPPPERDRARCGGRGARRAGACGAAAGAPRRAVPPAGRALHHRGRRAAPLCRARRRAAAGAAPRHGLAAAGFHHERLRRSRP
ncbi:MAG TPA: MFS transporter [Stellaceae bacterium]